MPTPRDLFPDFESGPHSRAPLADTEFRKWTDETATDRESWVAFISGIQIAVIRNYRATGWYVAIGDMGGLNQYIDCHSVIPSREEAMAIAREAARGERNYPLYAAKELRPRNLFGSEMADEQFADWCAAREASEREAA